MADESYLMKEKNWKIQIIIETFFKIKCPSEIFLMRFQLFYTYSKILKYCDIL